MPSHSVLRSSDGFEPLAARMNVPGSKPDVLLFDLCGVLFDDTIWSRWLFQLVSRVGTRLNYEQFVRAWEERFVVDVNSNRRDYWEAVQEYLESLDLSRAAANEICVAARARRRQFDESIRPLPGTKSGLANLIACGHRVAVIGNVPYDAITVRKRIAHLGLSEFFSEVYSSFDAGREFPAKSRYAWIGERLRIAANAIWFISGSTVQLGDAAAAGIRTIAWQLPQPLKSLHTIDDLLPVITGQTHSLAG